MSVPFCVSPPLQRPFGRKGWRKMRILALLSMTGVLVACTAGEDYQPPSMGLASTFSQTPGSTISQFRAEPWWEAFRDARLNKLVEEGMLQNLTLRQAMERVTSAEATAGAAGLTGTMSGQLSSTNTNDFAGNESRSKNGVLDISWIADFFGQYKRVQESADARLDEAFSNVEVARLIYLSELVSAYIDARYYQESLALKRKDLAVRRRTLELTADLLDAGEVTQLAVAQADGLVNETRAELPVLENGFHLAVNRIATLIGRPSSEILQDMSRGAPQPVPHRRVAVGIPADLIRNRADIRSAERRLASAVADAGIAEAFLYPSITLAGSLQANGVDGANAQGWSFGPVIDIPLFDMGQRQARVSVAESVARSRYLEWQQQVLNAVEEVENALSSVLRNGRAAAASYDVVKSYETAVELAGISYENQQITLLEVLDSQRSLEDARANWAASLRQQAQDFVSLNVALGGGQYAPRTAAAAPDADPTTVSAAAETTSTDTGPAQATWVVQPGETLYRIAINHGITPAELAAANGIAEPFIVRPGQTLIIPRPSSL